MNNRIYILKILFVLGGLITVVNSYAQKVNLTTYIDLVKKNNVQLKQSVNAIKIHNEDVKVMTSVLLPQFSIDGFYQRDFRKNYLFINDGVNGKSTRFRTNFNNTLNLSGTVTQTLYNQEFLSNVKTSKLAKDLSELTAKNTKNNLVTEAAILFWQALYLKESIAVFKENVALAKAQADQVKKVFTEGDASKLQVYQTEVLYKKAIPALNNAKKEYKNALYQLKILAGIPSAEKLIIEDRLENIELGNFSQLDKNVSKQPQIKIIQKRLEIIQKQLQSKRKFWHPEINLVLGYNFSGQDNRFNFGGNQNQLFFGQVRVVIPVFSGGRNRAKIAKTTIEKSTEELELKNKNEQLLKIVRTAKNNYDSSIKNIVSYKEAIDLTQQEIEIFNKQLRIGVITPIEFKEARVRYIQSKLALLNEYLNLHVAQLQIQQIIAPIN